MFKLNCSTFSGLEGKFRTPENNGFPKALFSATFPSLIMKASPFLSNSHRTGGDLQEFSKAVNGAD